VPQTTDRVVFGEQRRLRDVAGAPERWLFRALGVADPAHYLHFLAFRRMLDALPFTPTSILDAGCERADFTFYLARRYRDARVLGVDIDPRSIERDERVAPLLRLPNVRFALGDLAAMTFHDRFDLVVSIDTLEHIPAQSTAIRNLRDAMLPGGRAYFHIPTVRERPVPLSRFLTAFHEWAEHEHTARDLTAEEFVDAVRNAGLRVVDVRRTFGYWTGELATSLFALPYRNSLRNRVLQALLAAPCRLLARADSLPLPGPRYAVAVTAER
jgi:SAM-dependent methyltransferase